MNKKLLLISILFFCSAFSRPTTFDERKNCEESAGVWREFGKSCIDECEAKLDQFSICSNITTYGCECGKSRCWNGEKKTCVAINDYKKIFTARKKEEKEIAEEARKQREKAAEESQQSILNNALNTDKIEEKNKNSTTPAVVEQPKAQTPLEQQVRQPPSPTVNTNPNIPPLFLQQEKAKEETEKKKQKEIPAPPTSSTPGLPVIPLPQ